MWYYLKIISSCPLALSFICSLLKERRQLLMLHVITALFLSNMWPRLLSESAGVYSYKFVAADSL